MILGGSFGKYRSAPPWSLWDHLACIVVFHPVPQTYIRDACEGSTLVLSGLSGKYGCAPLRGSTGKFLGGLPGKYWSVLLWYSGDHWVSMRVCHPNPPVIIREVWELLNWDLQEIMGMLHLIPHGITWEVWECFTVLLRGSSEWVV